MKLCDDFLHKLLEICRGVVWEMQPRRQRKFRFCKEILIEILSFFSISHNLLTTQRYIALFFFLSATFQLIFGRLRVSSIYFCRVGTSPSIIPLIETTALSNLLFLKQNLFVNNSIEYLIICFAYILGPNSVVQVEWPKFVSLTSQSDFRFTTFFRFKGKKHRLTIFIINYPFEFFMFIYYLVIGH